MNRLRAAAGPMSAALMLAGLMLAGLLSGCAADDANLPDVVTRVTVGADSIQLTYGRRDTLRARATNSRGDVVASAPIVWASTNSSVVAIVDGNVALTEGVGTAYAIASSGVFADSTKVVVVRDTTLPADISVTIRGPIENQFIGDSLNLSLRISTKYSLAALRVVVGPTTIPLDLSRLLPNGGSGGSYTWNQIISLAGVPSGSFPLSVIATDVRNSSTTTTIPVRHDIPPKINILSPLNDYDVYTNSIPLRVACVDAEKPSCAELTVDFDGIGATGASVGRRVATGTSLIDVSVPTADWGVTAISVRITAKDSSTQGTIVQRTILVANNASLQRLVSVPGFVVDADGSRVLYTASGDTGSLRIRNGAGDDATIFGAPGLTVPQGYLMPFGALFTYADKNAPISYLLREYRNGSLLVLNGVTRQLVANAPYAAWTFPSPSPSPLTFRDFVAGTQRTVAIGNVQSFDVSASGHIVYSLNGVLQIVLDSTVISNDPNAAGMYPKTDGTRVIFTKLSPATSGTNTYTVLYSPTRLDTLAAYRATTPSGNYAISEGWVAFQKPDAAGTLQVWTRSPAGEEKQISIFAANSAVQLVAPDGTVVFANGFTRYVARPPYTSVIAFGDVNSRVMLRNGALQLFLGGSVFKIN